MRASHLFALAKAWIRFARSSGVRVARGQIRSNSFSKTRQNFLILSLSRICWASASMSGSYISGLEKTSIFFRMRRGSLPAFA